MKFFIICPSQHQRKDTSPLFCFSFSMFHSNLINICYSQLQSKFCYNYWSVDIITSHMAFFLALYQTLKLLFNDLVMVNIPTIVQHNTIDRPDRNIAWSVACIPQHLHFAWMPGYARLVPS